GNGRRLCGLRGGRLRRRLRIVGFLLVFFSRGGHRLRRALQQRSVVGLRSARAVVRGRLGIFLGVRWFRAGGGRVRRLLILRLAPLFAGQAKYGRRVANISSGRSDGGRFNRWLHMGDNRRQVFVRGSFQRCELCQNVLLIRFAGRQQI